MKYSSLILLLFISVISVSVSCTKDNDIVLPNENTEKNDTTVIVTSKIKIKVNTQTFTATLFENNSAKSFKEMLPMTINMVEFNGNEKYYNLPKSLPTNASNPGTIQNGDLMLYGSSTLVLFYKTFSTSYSYTKLGRIDDPAGLSEALSDGNVSVTFELQYQRL
ncbi:MAG: cyclophilin-like fold protein [Bacteroidales bacterium]